MILRPAVYPEEIYSGYMGRVMRRNGCRTNDEIEILLRTWAGVTEKSKREIPSLRLLSQVAGIELPIFVKNHTMIPLNRFIQSGSQDVEHGNEKQLSLLWTIGIRKFKPGAYFCEECVHEDQKFHGESYWRREHQIIGLMYCPKHIAPLKFVDDDLAFLSSPASHINECHSVDKLWAKSTYENQTIRTYIDISSSLLNARSPFKINDIVSILKSKAASMGFKTHGKATKGKAKLLSDEIIKSVGRDWLCTVHPALAKKMLGETMVQVDGMLNSRNIYAIPGYILAFSTLYDSTDNALNAMQSKPNQKSSGQAQHEDVSIDEIFEAYVQARGCYKQIAADLSYNTATFRRLKSMGLPSLESPRGTNFFKAAVSFCVEKNSLQISAEQGGISIDEMESFVRESGPELTRALIRMSPRTSQRYGKSRAKPLNPHEAKELAENHVEFASIQS